ncbi:hypothetical protein D3C72_1654960 [compost metagenome]
MISFLFFYRNRFTRQHGFINVTVAIRNLSVNGDFVPGFYFEYISDLNLIYANFFIYSIFYARSFGRAQLDQLFDCRIGFGMCFGLHHLA